METLEGPLNLQAALVPPPLSCSSLCAHHHRAHTVGTSLLRFPRILLYCSSYPSNTEHHRRMGRPFRVFPKGEKVYSCCQCRCPLATQDELVSKVGQKSCLPSWVPKKTCLKQARERPRWKTSDSRSFIHHRLLFQIFMM